MLVEFFFVFFFPDKERGSTRFCDYPLKAPLRLFLQWSNGTLILHSEIIPSAH